MIIHFVGVGIKILKNIQNEEGKVVRGMVDDGYFLGEDVCHMTSSILGDMIN